MSGASVFGIVDIEISAHGDTIPPESLVIFRSRQRRQTKKLKQVDRQLPLDNCNIASDRRGCIRWKTQNIAGEGYDALPLPSEQHFAIFRDFVLTLLCRGQVIRIYVFEADENLRDAGSLRLQYEVGDLMTERINLIPPPKRLESMKGFFVSEAKW